MSLLSSLYCNLEKSRIGSLLIKKGLKATGHDHNFMLPTILRLKFNPIETEGGGEGKGKGVPKTLKLNSSKPLSSDHHTQRSFLVSN